MPENLKIKLRYYGISPWEIEVLYGFLNSHFTIIQDEIESDEEGEDFVSFFDMEIPLTFNEAFFQWFEFKRWDKIKAVFKEMKRRRGNGNGLKINVNFSGNPKIIFTVDNKDKQWFNSAIEKIDGVLELLQYHLDPKKLPSSEISEITYKFDSKLNRWCINTTSSEKKKYSLNEDDTWKEIT